MLRHVCCGARSALIGLSFLLVGCQQNPYSGNNLPVASGIVQETTDFAPVVMVILPGGTALCSGTLISTQAVLTAAHCALDSGQYTVLMSDAQTGKTDQFTTSTVVHLGPGSVSDQEDVAVIVFPQPIASSSQVYGIASSVSVGDTLQLVGYGCDNVDTRDGAGVKRTGTNVVNDIDGFIEFITPATSDTGFGTQALTLTPGRLTHQEILGPGNLAGSCFGDSGGPALAQSGNTWLVAGVTHAGGSVEGNSGPELDSQYVNVASSSTVRAFLSQVNTQYNLGVQGL